MAQNFLTSLAQKMGWKYRTSTNALDRFIELSMHFGKSMNLARIKAMCLMIFALCKE